MDEINSHSVTAWIRRLRTNDQSAAAAIWERYFVQLVRIAKRKLRQSETRMEDEEDVALSVLDCLFSGARAGRFSQLTDRQDLWVLLLSMTHNKCVDQVRRTVAQKRGGGTIQGEGDLLASNGRNLNEMVSPIPMPETLAILQDEYERLLSLLRDEDLRQVAAWRLEGHSTEDIAEFAGLSTRSIRRKLELIRDTWMSAMDVTRVDDDGCG